MTLLQTFSTEISNLERLKKVAANAGFGQTFDLQGSEDSIRLLLESLIAGQAVIVKRPEPGEVTEETLHDLEFQLKLFAKGLTSEIKPIRKRRLSPFNPIAVEGEPVSQTVIRDRR